MEIFRGSKHAVQLDVCLIARLPLWLRYKLRGSEVLGFQIRSCDMFLEKYEHEEKLSIIDLEFSSAIKWHRRIILLL